MNATILARGVRVLLAAAAGLFALPDSGAKDGEGSLVIVGGALRATNHEVLRAFIDRTHGGRIGIIPAASSKPANRAGSIRSQLVALGVSEDRIEVLPLAVKDDPETAGVDESAWAGRGGDAGVAERIDGLSGLWFTGGDQERIMRVLRPTSGQSSVVERAVHAVLQRGGVIGGTSAGAAVMSDPIILGGTSPEALRHGVDADYPGMAAQEDGPLILGAGLGVFPHGLIDQHFDRKARLGRLIVALGADGSRSAVGFGIDEDTALVCDLASGVGTVVGAATVAVVDGRAMQTAPWSWRGVRISVLAPGDRINLVDLAVTPAPGRKATRGAEYMNIPASAPLSLLSPYSGRLDDVLGYLLVDNRGASRVEARVQSADGTGFLVAFRKDERTEGYWDAADGEWNRYTAVNAVVDIERIGP